MENAIRFAIEGGYRGNSIYQDPTGPKDDSWHFDVDCCERDLLLDPLFWQCLGKQQGWDIESCDHEHTGKTQNSYCSSCIDGAGVSCREHMYHWHRFVDHIAEGKDVDDFFKNLLK